METKTKTPKRWVRTWTDGRYVIEPAMPDARWLREDYLFEAERLANDNKNRRHLKIILGGLINQLRATSNLDALEAKYAALFELLRVSFNATAEFYHAAKPGGLAAMIAANYARAEAETMLDEAYGRQRVTSGGAAPGVVVNIADGSVRHDDDAP